MALKKPTPPAAGAVSNAAGSASTAAAPAPSTGAKFEEPGVTTTVAPQTSSITAEDKSKVAGALAVAKIGASSLAKQGKFEVALTDLRDVIPSVEFGTFPRLVGSNGNVMDKDGKALGQFVDLQLLSWTETYVVSPGEDSDEAKKSVRYSRDGVTIDETGESVAAYLEQLRTVDGYENAAKKKYIELVGILEKADKTTDHLGQLVQVSLSPQSLKSFEGYRANVSVQVRLGKREIEGAERVRVTPELKSGNGKNWTLLKVAAAPA